MVLLAVCGAAPESSQGSPLQQLRQLGDVGGDAPRLVAGEQLGSSSKWTRNYPAPRVSRAGSCMAPSLLPANIP